MVLQQGGVPRFIITLSSDDIHLFCASLDQPTSRLQHLAETLSADEQMRAESVFLSRIGSISSLLVDLRTILASYVDIEPSRLIVIHGKPVLAETFAKGKLRFNLSHPGLAQALLP